MSSIFSMTCRCFQAWVACWAKLALGRVPGSSHITTLWLSQHLTSQLSDSTHNTKHSQSPGPHSGHHNNLVSNICRRMSSHYSGSSSVSEFKQVQEELSKSPGFAREQEIVWSQAQPRPPNIRLISQHLRLMSPLHTSHSYVSILGTVLNT